MMPVTTLKQQILPHIVEIIETLKASGYRALIVGGAVRDLLLGRPPKDYDIATTATPEEVRKVFKRKIHTMIVGRRFRLVHLIRGEEIIEVSTFRRKPLEGAQTDRPASLAGSAPENMIFHDNEFGTPSEDAWRRDFTVNALFYDPVEDRIFDYTGMGLMDLENKVVRAIGEPYVRFEEDPVRILRALKLIGQCGFTFEKKTAEAIEEAMPLIKLASDSRLSLELEKILKSPYGDDIVQAFHEHGFLSYYLPYFEKHWNEMELQRKMWKVRDERVRSGAYRDSISVVISLLALPLVNVRGNAKQAYGNAVERAMGTLIHPRALPGRMLEAAGRNVALQSRFTNFSAENMQSLQSMRGYAQARELMVIRSHFDSELKEAAVKWPCAKNNTKPSGRRKSGPRGRRSTT